ncbi:MAG: hypothetical protein KTR35_17205 [Gammaproteobacteria bacterium]|nr:hypothetical protein [Gammaproteobacteria bacterium]
MSKYGIGLAALLTSALALVACSDSDGDNPEVDGGSTATDGGSNAGTDGGSGGGGQGPYFDADEGYDFANDLGASLSRLFSVGLGGAGSSGLDASGSMQEFINRARSEDTIVCDSGSVTVYTDTDDSTGNITSSGYIYNDCVIDGIGSNGEVTVSGFESENGESASFTIIFDEFTSIDGAEIASIDGSVSVSFSGDDNGFNYGMSGPSLTLVDSEGTLVFTNFSMTASASSSTGQQSLQASATISDNNETITITINPALAYGSSDLYPTTGQIVMTHSDGSSLAINADNGNPETFSYTVSDGSTVVSGEEFWYNTDLVFDE